MILSARCCSLPLLCGLPATRRKYGHWYDVSAEQDRTRCTSRLWSHSPPGWRSCSASACGWPPCYRVGTLVFLNREFYRFFARQRGVLFATAVIPFHLLYYLYSVAGLALGLLAAYAARRQRRIAEPTSPAMSG